MSILPSGWKRRVVALALGLGALLLSATGARAQATYAWNQTGSGAFSTAGNWTPSRTSPQATDILVISGTSTPAPTITDVQTETIARLRIINGANVALSANTNSRVLTLVGTGTPALDIAAGSTLAMQGTRAYEIALGSGATASIAGSVSMADQAQILTSPDMGAITFLAGSSFATLSGFRGNPFGATGTANVAVFQSGSTYTHNAGNDPFALTAPASKAVFQPGSTFVVRASSGVTADGRAYANLTVDNSTALTASGTGTFQFQTLLVNTGSSF